jgi:uncharacterized membrane protein
VYIVWTVFGAIDSLLPFKIPGVGFVATIALITLVGVLTSNVVGRSLLDLAESQLQRLPLVKLVYTSIKDLVGAFVGDKRRFEVPVAVSPFPGTDARLLGFVTRDGLAGLGLPDHLAVYLPQSYNFAGCLMLFPRDRVVALDLSPSEVMTFIVSGGVSGFGRGESILPTKPLART